MNTHGWQLEQVWVPDTHRENVCVEVRITVNRAHRSSGKPLVLLLTLLPHTPLPLLKSARQSLRVTFPGRDLLLLVVLGT